ncbi:MAG: hypothetical protein ACREKM_06260, partial [Longimicrobiales bacterium]
MALRARTTGEAVARRQPLESDATTSIAGVRPDLMRFLAIAAQLGLVLWALYALRIEQNLGLPRILPVIFIGFVVHAWLPAHTRHSFFLALSFLAIGVVFGLEYGMALIALGLSLIAICHLPIPFAARVALLVAVAAVLAGVRAEWIPIPGGRMPNLPTMVLPILASMFMFRLVVYLYDLRHEKKPASVAERLSYFFLLPNICFPLFPVVDYQTYRRTYYDRDALDIYEKGVFWIFRGMMHLVLYRIVYMYFVPTPAEVQNLWGVVQSMTSTYLLYLRISGQFHLIVGILCLFGYNLPETHKLYYLASGFNDYWRRINIYWKDFMMKLFYYPSLMRLRKLGVTTAMVIATLIVFAGTWLLHSYQWFWLRGTFPLAATDALFWGILGGLVVLNSLREARRGRKRSLSKPEWSLRAALLHSAKTVGMLVFITVLWSLWSSPTVGEWLSLVSAARNTDVQSILLLAGALLAIVGAGVLLQYLIQLRAGAAPAGGAAQTHIPLRWPGRLVAATALAMVLLTAPQVNALLGEPGTDVVAAVRENGMNERDAEQLERGYYEGLLDSDRYTTALFSVTARRPSDWGLEGEGGTRNSRIARKLDGVLDYELIPLYQGEYKHESFRVNEWSMRDLPYEREKPDGVFRMALLGASYEMGAGVGVGRTFENLVEARLNQDRAGQPYERYEILNFSAGGYSVVHNLVIAEERAFAFEPDAIVFAMHATEARRLRTHLRSIITRGIEVPYPYLRDVLRQTGATADMREGEIHRRIEPVLDDVV